MLFVQSVAIFLIKILEEKILEGAMAGLPFPLNPPVTVVGLLPGMAYSY